MLLYVGYEALKLHLSVPKIDALSSLTSPSANLCDDIYISHSRVAKFSEWHSELALVKVNGKRYGQ